MSDAVKTKEKRKGRYTAVKIGGSAHLTRGADLSTAAAISATYEGMAHFARSGPVGKTCRECAFWCRAEGVKGSYARTEGHLRPRKCRMYRTLTGGADGRDGKGIPHDAAACKYFVAAERPPMAVAKPRKKRGE